MKVILTKNNDDAGRLSVRDVSEEKAVWFCRTAVGKGLWMACWTNAKGVRLVAVSGKWEEVEERNGKKSSGKTVLTTNWSIP